MVDSHKSLLQPPVSLCSTCSTSRVLRSTPCTCFRSWSLPLASRLTSEPRRSKHNKNNNFCSAVTQPCRYKCIHYPTQTAVVIVTVHLYSTSRRKLRGI